MSNSHRPPAEVLALLGLSPAHTSCQALHQRRDRVLYRLRSGSDSYVLKHYPNTGNAAEVAVYELLGSLGVPIVPLMASTGNALLLADLQASPGWRLATPHDLTDRSVGQGIARWYASLHRAGELQGRSTDRPAILVDGYEALSVEMLTQTGQRLGLSEVPAWQRATAELDRFKAEQRALPRSLLYNDFHYSNLALHDGEPTLRAVMFDLHLLGTGPTVCDYRNVVTGLEGAARNAFRDTYGTPTSHELALDAPLALLAALCAVDADTPVPRWARGLCQEVADGGLDRKLAQALEVIGL